MSWREDPRLKWRRLEWDGGDHLCSGRKGNSTAGHRDGISTFFGNSEGSKRGRRILEGENRLLDVS